MEFNTDTGTFPILVVEDSPEDFEATERAIHWLNIPNPVVNCEDTDSALDYLFQRGQYSEPGTAPRPGIVILDLDLPGNGGLEVLTAAKSDPELKAIPIIVFSSSYDERDIQSCYRAGANSYIRKPMSSEQFLATIQQIRAYWFKLAILPSTQV